MWTVKHHPSTNRLGYFPTRETSSLTHVTHNMHLTATSIDSNVGSPEIADPATTRIVLFWCYCHFSVEKWNGVGNEVGKMKKVLAQTFGIRMGTRTCTVLYRCTVTIRNWTVWRVIWYVPVLQHRNARIGTRTGTVLYPPGTHRLT